MTLFGIPERNAANPPSSWAVVKVADRVWNVHDAEHLPGDGPLDVFATKTKAVEAAAPGGRLHDAWERERDWFAGTLNDPRLRSWADCEAKARPIHEERWLSVLKHLGLVAAGACDECGGRITLAARDADWAHNPASTCRAQRPAVAFPRSLSEAS